MSVEFYREPPGKFDSRTLSRETLGGLGVCLYIYIYIYNDVMILMLLMILMIILLMINT